MPYNRLPRPRACPEGKLPDGRNVPNRRHLGTHNTDGVSSGRLLRNGARGVVTPLTTAAARPFIAISTVAPGLPPLWTTISAHSVRLISGSIMGVASISTATTSSWRPRLPQGCHPPAMPTTTMVAAGSEHLSPAPWTSEREHLAPAPRALQRAYRADRAEDRRDGSQFHRLADRVRHLQDHHRHQTANSQRTRQD